MPSNAKEELSTVLEAKLVEYFLPSQIGKGEK